MNQFTKEAKIFGRYLLDGQTPNEKSISLYETAMQIRPITIESEEKILRFILKNPSTIGMVDSAFAFSKKKSAVRRKILFMSAILETQPAYAELFLPQERNWTYTIYILWVGFRAVLKAVAGRFLLLFF